MGESVPNSAGAYWKHSQANEKANVKMERISSSIQLEGKVDRRTKELEKQHRQEGNWFQPEVGEQANYQSRMVWDVTKGDEQMEQQMVWDLTNNCYQQLPVQQGSPYLPTYHQLYPCPRSYSRKGWRKLPLGFVHRTVTYIPPHRTNSFVQLLYFNRFFFFFIRHSDRNTR